MAANYWTSTHHRHWTFTKPKLQSLRANIESSNQALTTQYPLPDQRLISIFLRDQLLKLARRLPTRQPILSTTLLYLSRYWLLRPIRTTNPFLLLATCFYLASKTEELPHHIRLVLTEAKNLWPEFIPGDVYRMGECEFEVISALKSQLIVFHPYAMVAELSGRGDQTGNSGGGASAAGGAGLGVGVTMSNAFPQHQNYGYGQNQGYINSQNASNRQNQQSSDSSNNKKWSLNLTQEETAMAWSIVNDSYLTDLPLIYPPHIMAVTATFLAVVFQPSRAPGLTLHSISSSQQQQSQAQPQTQPPFHALPPKPPSFHHQSSSSLGGTRSLASALRDSTASTLSAPSSPNPSPNTITNNSHPSPSSSSAPTSSSTSQPPQNQIPTSEKVEKMISFLAESEIDLEKILDATQEIISLYEVWEAYSEKGIKEGIGRMVRGRGLDK